MSDWHLPIEAVDVASSYPVLNVGRETWSEEGEGETTVDSLGVE